MRLTLLHLKEILSREFNLLDDTRSKVLLISLSAFFATAFILVYDPLGISSFKINTRLGNALTIYSAGIVGASTLILTQIILRPLFNLSAFKVGSYLLWTSFEFALICIIIFLVFGERGLPFWDEFMLTSRFAIILALVPYTISCLMIALFKDKKEGVFTSQKERLLSPELITLSDENDKSVITLKADSIIFMKAADNYVEVYYYDQNEVHKKLIRTRLKQMEQKIEHVDLVRTHRSYIVNQQKIRIVNRIGSKIELRMEHMKEMAFPISATYRHQFEAKVPVLEGV